MWPIQLAFIIIIVCGIFLPSSTLCNTYSFVTWSIQLIFFILLQYHISELLICRVQVSAIQSRTPNVPLYWLLDRNFCAASVLCSAVLLYKWRTRSVRTRRTTAEIRSLVAAERLTGAVICCFLVNRLLGADRSFRSWNIEEFAMLYAHINMQVRQMYFILFIFFYIYFADRASQCIYLNVNQLDALNFIMSLFHASTCFGHKCSSSGGQNCTIQSLVSSHL